MDIFKKYRKPENNPFEKWFLEKMKEDLTFVYEKIYKYKKKDIGRMLNYKGDIRYEKWLLSDNSEIKINSGFIFGYSYNKNTPDFTLIEDSMKNGTLNQKIIFYCIFSKNGNGYIRETAVKKLLSFNNLPEWSIPYILERCSDYVYNIVKIIYDYSTLENIEKYKRMFNLNPKRLALSYDKMISYWWEWNRYLSENEDLRKEKGLEIKYTDNTEYEDKEEKTYKKSVNYENYKGYKIFNEFFGYNDDFKYNEKSGKIELKKRIRRRKNKKYKRLS